MIANKALIMDEQPLIRWAVRELLMARGAEWVAEAATIPEARDIIKYRKPDFVITELKFSDEYCFDFVREMTSENEMLRIIAFSDIADCESVEKFKNARGVGFVSKRDSIQELLNAIESAIPGSFWISPVTRAFKPAICREYSN